MTIRTKRKTVTFNNSFSLEGLGRSLPKELIGVSFPVYRRLSTMMFVPADCRSSAIEMLTVDPHELAAALERDASTGPTAVK